nr:unnamed protein product [Callosobruchus chinensis]
MRESPCTPALSESVPIYVSSQWIPVIRLAKKNRNPYSVSKLEASDIYDLKGFAGDMGKNSSENVETKKVLWSNIKILNFKKTEPYTVDYKYNYYDTDYKMIDIRGRKSTRSLTTNKLSLRLAYDCPPKISKEKKDGLLFLRNTNAIKEQYHSFF